MKCTSPKKGEKRGILGKIEVKWLRTGGRREVDLLLESEQGFIRIECKMTTNPARNDFQAMRNLTTAFPT
jgi:hypothetical protein